MNWINQDLVNIDKHYGFIYLIEYTNKKKYIGKKSLYAETNQPARKDGKAREGHYKFYNKIYKRKRTVFETTRKLSNWKTYNGSSKLTKGFTIARKTIIEACDTQLDLTYKETYHLMINNVLFDDAYMNQCIGRHYFSGRLTGSKEWIKEDK